MIVRALLMIIIIESTKNYPSLDVVYVNVGLEILFGATAWQPSFYFANRAGNW
jgi:hypothetical protein